MSRNMVDCTGGNAATVKSFFPDPDLVAWYGTGSPDIQWTADERALWPADRLVEIDQGAAGSPVLAATVRDVENGAWSPLAAVNQRGWDVERPTIYCNRNDLDTVAALGWQGDIWLAWPGWTGEPLPEHPGITIVAVQDEWRTTYDLSTVLDPTWPHTNRTVHDMINIELGALDYRFVPFPEGSFATISVYQHYASAKQAVTLTVGFHSALKGFTTTPHVIAHGTPLHLAFPASDIDGVYLHNSSVYDHVGITIS